MSNIFGNSVCSRSGVGPFDAIFGEFVDGVDLASALAVGLDGSTGHEAKTRVASSPLKPPALPERACLRARVIALPIVIGFAWAPLIAVAPDSSLMPILCAFCAMMEPKLSF